MRELIAESEVLVPDNVAYYDRLAPLYSMFFQDLEKSMQEEGEWLASVLQARGAHHVLDACCGTGRQIIPLAERGFEVVGGDPSAAMLHEARALALSRGLEVTLLRCCFDRLPEQIEQPFDAVIAMGNGLCHLDRREAIRDALCSLRACYREGGMCLIGVKDFDRIRRERPRIRRHRSIMGPAGRRTLYQVWQYQDPILVVTAYLGQRDSGVRRTEVAETREYMLGQQEFCELARDAGFRRMARLEHRSEAVYALEP